MVTDFNDPSARPSSEVPNYIEPNHLKEWLDSGVNQDLIALNVRSLLNRPVRNINSVSKKW
jgi:hypothetical protein